MRFSLFIWGSLLASTLGGFHFAHAQEPQGKPLYPLAEAVFDRAEARFPELFAPDGLTLALVDGVEAWAPYWFYRYYAASGTYLAFREKDRSVYVLGPAFGSEVTRVGELKDILLFLGSGIGNPGTGECVDIPSPTPGTDAYYEGTGVGWGQDRLTGEWVHDSVVSWQQDKEGRLEMVRYTGSLQNRVHYYTETSSVTSDAGLNYLNSFSRVYIRNEPSYTESLTQVYTPSRLLGPSSHYCLGQTWISAGGITSSVRTYFPSENSIPPYIDEWDYSYELEQVVNISTPIVVPAGEFVTIEVRSLLSPYRTRWIDIESGIVVKEYEHWYDRNMTEIHELLRIETAGQ